MSQLTILALSAGCIAIAALAVLLLCERARRRPDDLKPDQWGC